MTSTGNRRHRSRIVLLIAAAALACIIIPVMVGGFNTTPGGFDVNLTSVSGGGLPATVQPAPVNPAGPQIVYIGTYIVDFSNYNPREGTFDTNFYVTLTSDRPVNTTDFELINGHAQTIGLLIDTPNKKYFRVFASMDSNPDFHRYPFDRQTLPIIVEPRVFNSNDMVLVIDKNSTGLDPLAALPGWKFGTMDTTVMNYTYGVEDIPYSRADFSCDISRDSFSTFLKFFLPVLLIVIVSLSSLLMKVTPRLGLNASMFLAAVLIHWRIADAIPLVEYATFLDYFMMITYATLVMVLVSGILVILYIEKQDAVRAEFVNHWSVRLIPVISVSLYILLFLSVLH
jgi:hypothetical protein